MKSAASILLALTFSAILLTGLYSRELSRRAFTDAALEARENKEAFYLARNAEESFWQTLSETAAACPKCTAEEVEILTQGNFLRWRAFWEGHGIHFSWASPAALSGLPISALPGAVAVSVVDSGAVRIFSFSVSGAGIFGNVENRTYAIIGAGEERACQVSAPEPRCIWKVS
ncbi:MAG: hypothetical protein V1820_04650 [archaeon]